MCHAIYSLVQQVRRVSPALATLETELEENALKEKDEVMSDAGTFTFLVDRLVRAG